MRLLLDIDVLLDVVLDREPWSGPAAELLEALERKRAEGFLASHMLPTIYYVVAKARDRPTAVQAMHDLLGLVEIAEVGRSEIERALTLEIADFKDAVQAAAALRVDAVYLVTRNERDFRSSPVATIGPGGVVALL